MEHSVRWERQGKCAEGGQHHGAASSGASTVTLGPWVNLKIGVGALPAASNHLAAGSGWKTAEGIGGAGYQLNSVALGDGYVVKMLNR